MVLKGSRGYGSVCFYFKSADGGVSSVNVIIKTNSDCEGVIPVIPLVVPHAGGTRHLHAGWGF